MKKGGNQTLFLGKRIPGERRGNRLPLTCPHCPPAMEIWCRSRIPVEGNFGQTYDSVNQSIHGLGGDFSATINLKVGGGCILEWGGVREWEEGTGKRT